MTAVRSGSEAIFIVGVHRSGTTLMRSILNASSAIAVASENHYLGHLFAAQGVHRAVRRLGDLRDDRVVERVVGLIYDHVAKPTRFRDPSRAWVWLTRQVPREEFHRRLLASNRSESSVFETLLRAYAEHKGKAVIGEKTPAHVRYADTLLRWFPGGRIIHMQRDPRAIYVSDLRRRRQHPGSLPYRLVSRLPALLAGVLLLQTTFTWLESTRRMVNNRRRYPGRYLVVRFELLVVNPRAEVERICRFLDIDFEEAMLDRVVVSRGQALGSAGFEAQAASRWRRQLSPFASTWFRLWLGRRMRASGYAD